jgi:Domain of Unknown Function (DUF1543)
VLKIFKSNNIQALHPIFYISIMQKPKLYMLLLGCKPPGRHTEQHDVFFGIAPSLPQLLPQIHTFWPQTEVKVHIDAWREVTAVDGYQIKIVPKQADKGIQKQKLFFINLGGYQANKFEEQHYIVLTVKETSALASKQAKETLFYKHNHIPGGTSHIDDKYGVDVDDIYAVEEILPPALKEEYGIELIPTAGLPEDELHLGYVKLSLLEANMVKLK